MAKSKTRVYLVALMGDVVNMELMTKQQAIDTIHEMLDFDEDDPKNIQVLKVIPLSIIKPDQKTVIKFD